MATKHLPPRIPDAGRMPARRRIVDQSMEPFEWTMGRLLEDFFTNYELAGLSVFEDEFHPRVDVHEDEAGISISAELPGLQEEDIEVVLGRNVITIRGEKQVECAVEGQASHCVERSFGRFRRDIALPAEVDPERVEATFKNGVLGIRLIKRQPERQVVRRIEINRK